MQRALLKEFKKNMHADSADFNGRSQKKSAKSAKSACKSYFPSINFPNFAIISSFSLNILYRERSFHREAE
jgi:hypothetical protein